MADREMFDLVTPIQTGNGHTLWHKIGTAFKNENPEKRHLFVMSILSLPLNIQGELKIFMFPKTEYRGKRRDNGPATQPEQPGFDYGPPPVGDDDVPF